MGADPFAEVFTALRALLETYAERPGFVSSASSGRYQLSSATRTDRAGNPLFIAAVHVNRHYVSYHLMPIYMNPRLLAVVSPALKKRMQGKSCFNFTVVDPTQLAELRELTARGIDAVSRVKLPWEEKPGRRRNVQTVGR